MSMYMSMYMTTCTCTCTCTCTSMSMYYGCSSVDTRIIVYYACIVVYSCITPCSVYHKCIIVVLHNVNTRASDTPQIRRDTTATWTAIHVFHELALGVAFRNRDTSLLRFGSGVRSWPRRLLRARPERVAFGLLLLLALPLHADDRRACQFCLVFRHETAQSNEHAKCNSWSCPRGAVASSRGRSGARPLDHNA